MQLDRMAGFQPRKIEEFSYSLDPVNQEEQFIFLAEQEEGIIGKIEVITGLREDTGLMGYVRRLVVHPDYRRQGIATKLFDFLQKWGRENELQCLDLHVGEENHSAITLYEKYGFDLRHKEHHYRLPLKEEKQGPQQTSLFDL